MPRKGTPDRRPSRGPCARWQDCSASDSTTSYYGGPSTEKQQEQTRESARALLKELDQRSSVAIDRWSARINAITSEAIDDAVSSEEVQVRAMAMRSQSPVEGRSKPRPVKGATTPSDPPAVDSDALAADIGRVAISPSATDSPGAALWELKPLEALGEALGEAPPSTAPGEPESLFRSAPAARHPKVNPRVVEGWGGTLAIRDESASRGGTLNHFIAEMMQGIPDSAWKREAIAKAQRDIIEQAHQPVLPHTRSTRHSAEAR